MQRVKRRKIGHFVDVGCVLAKRAVALSQMNEADCSMDSRTECATITIVKK